MPALVLAVAVMRPVRRASRGLLAYARGRRGTRPGGLAYLNDGVLSTSCDGVDGGCSPWTPWLIWVRDLLAVGSVTRWFIGRSGGSDSGRSVYRGPPR